MLRRLVGAACVAAVSLAVSAGPVAAHDLPGDWRYGHPVGDTCAGLTSGHYVKWVQALLWADNDLSGTGSGTVDGYFGPVTRWGVGSYQNGHGIAPADGCAGVRTYEHMMLAHRYYIGNFGPDRYQYRGEKTVTLSYDFAYDCWWVWWLPTEFEVVHSWGRCDRDDG